MDVTELSHRKSGRDHRALFLFAALAKNGDNWLMILSRFQTRTMLFLAMASSGCGLSAHAQRKPHSVQRAAGFVPDAETAIRIAVAVWLPIYGRKRVESKKPYKAVLSRGVWMVYGTLPKGWIGGTPEAEIDKSDGRILRVSHGR